MLRDFCRLTGVSTSVQRPLNVGSSRDSYDLHKVVSSNWHISYNHPDPVLSYYKLPIASASKIIFNILNIILYYIYTEVYSIAFSPDGSRIVSSSSDNTIRLWDEGTGDAIVKPLEEHSSYIYSVAFSPDGSRIVSGSSDNTICLWDVDTGDPIGKPLDRKSVV